MTLLAHIVDASRRVSETSSRLEKIRVIAEALRAVERDEIAIAIAYLAGETCQGKIGASYASLRDAAAAAPLAQPVLTLPEVDRVLAHLVTFKGKGAAGKRAQTLSELFARASA